MDEEYERHVIPKFGLELCVPTWWLSRQEGEDTHVFWDEYTGSFRITPFVIGNEAGIRAELELVKVREVASNPELRKFGDRDHVCYVQDSPKDGGGTTRIHYYISGFNGKLLVCSFAYDKELVDNEFSADQVDAALEEVDLILDSIAVFSDDIMDDDAP